MKSSTNRAFVAMKQSTFSAVMANSIKNLLQGYTKGIRFVAVLTMLLTLGIGQAWAGAGFWDNGGITLTFTVNTSSVTRTLNSGSQGGTTSLGTVTTAMTLKSVKANVWKDGSGNICTVNMFYRVKNSSGTVVLDKSGTATALSWSSDNGSNQVWQNTNIGVDLMNGGLAPGTYTFECWFTATGNNSSSSGCGTTFWYSNNSNNYKYTFIIPSKKLTVAGAANGNTVSGTVTGITKGKAYTITATPTTGYSFSKWTASSGASSITIANANAASTTVTFKDYVNDATVTASFTLATYTVKWVVDGKEQATETVDHGKKPTNAPTLTPEQICGDKFVGWVTAPIEGQLEDAFTLTIYTTDNLPAITGETTFYAVFANYEE